MKRLVLFVLLLLPVHLMAAVTYRASGTFTASTGTCTAPMPAGEVADDILLLVIESENQAISLTTANGFVEVTNSPQSAGTAGVDPANRIAVYWKRAVGSDSSPVAADSGDHTTCQIHAFIGAITSGNPWDITAGGNDGGVNDVSANIPGASTSVINTLVVVIEGMSNNGTATNVCGTPTNADLGSLTIRTNNTNTSGLGGGHCMITGTKATIGTYATTTLTLTVSSFKGAMSIALKPVPDTAGVGDLVTHIIEGSTTNNGFTTSTSIDTTTATWIGVAISDSDGTCTLSDSKSNSWTLWVTQAAAPTPVLRIYRADSPTVGSGHTFTTTCTAKGPSIAVMAWKNTTGSPPADQSISSGATGVSTIQAGNLTPTTASNAIMSAVADFAQFGLSINLGFTLLDQVGYASSQHYSLGTALLAQVAATARNPTWTLPSATDSAAANFSIKIASATAGGLLGRMGTLGVGR